MTGLDWLWTYLSVLFLWWLIWGGIISLLATTPGVSVKAEARRFLLGPVWPLVLPVVLARGAVWLWRQAFPKEKP